MTKQIYSCQLCDWVKISDNILDFNFHASIEHRAFFFDDPDKAHTRNEKRLRDYVNLMPIARDKGSPGPV